jgi:hypothetical protein
MKKLFVTLLSCCVSMAAGVACDENPESDVEFGTIEMTTTAPTAEKEFTTVDGWTIKVAKFLVSVSAVTIQGDDGVLVASATGQVVDQAKPGAKLLLTSGARTARPWEQVSFQIGPATVDSLGVDVPEPDLSFMTKGGLTLYLEASATKVSEKKQLKWSFTPDTLYSDCQGDLNGVNVRGLIVPANGKDSADIVMRVDSFFSEKLDGTGALKFTSLAVADQDINGEVTLEELSAVTLEKAREDNNGTYDVGAATDVTDLKTFVSGLADKIVGSYRTKGTCKAGPPPVVAP